MNKANYAFAKSRDPGQTKVNCVPEQGNQVEQGLPNSQNTTTLNNRLPEIGISRTQTNPPGQIWTGSYIFQSPIHLRLSDYFYRQTAPLTHPLINPACFFHNGFVQPIYPQVSHSQVPLFNVPAKDQGTQTPFLDISSNSHCPHHPLVDSQEPFLSIMEAHLYHASQPHFHPSKTLNSGLVVSDFNPESSQKLAGLACQMRSKKLGQLSSIVQKLFLQNQVSEEEFNVLSKFEKQLLYYLIKRKYIPKYLKGVEPEEVTCNYQKIVSMVSSLFPRRPEECYKFILTRVLKHLRKKVEMDFETSDPEAKLYEILFRGISDELGIPMADFHYPLSGNSKGKFQFNFIYFSKVFQSVQFLHEIEVYCQNDVFEEYHKELAKKINALFSKWEKMLVVKDQLAETAQQLIIKYVIHNKRCKLPWTKADVVHAIDKVTKLVKMCSSQPSDAKDSNSF